MYATTPKTGKRAVFAKPTSIPPLPLPSIKRRTTVIPPKQAPPSIIGFLRKNAGKDLSTVSMPVTANEPTSALQRVAENMEYSHLLDSAASSSLTPAERLLHIAAFALSTLSANRVKERALRKPFNPMLGETFELVREDLGFRFVAEKISHHPVRMACQAESLTNGGWSFAQAPQPTQKFWGKSVELNTEGEKYVEPVHNLTIIEESGELRAVCTFKAGGMFSGRSEDVTLQLLDRDGTVLPLGLTGKWTESLIRTDINKPIWTAGALVPDSAKHFGFTAFAATLNEITENESGFLAPTDSRLRPDQRAYEHGNVDDAEAMKAKLEERQRSRRKVLEGHGKQWEPRFFERVDGAGEETWRLKEKGGYWDRRMKGDWNGVEEVFEL
ncbi:Oxysterol-binding protein 3 [Oleoguttula sp. CCFEE 5521]